MYGPFLQEMPDTVEKDKIQEWTRKIDLKVETEALIFAAHVIIMTGRFECDQSVRVACL